MRSAYYAVHREIMQISIEGIRCPIGNQYIAKPGIPERYTLLVLLLTGYDSKLNFEEISLLSYSQKKFLVLKDEIKVIFRTKGYSREEKRKFCSLFRKRREINLSLLSKVD